MPGKGPEKPGKTTKKEPHPGVRTGLESLGQSDELRPGAVKRDQAMAR